MCDNCVMLQSKLSDISSCEWWYLITKITNITNIIWIYLITKISIGAASDASRLKVRHQVAFALEQALKIRIYVITYMICYWRRPWRYICICDFHDILLEPFLNTITHYYCFLYGYFRVLPAHQQVGTHRCVQVQVSRFQGREPPRQLRKDWWSISSDREER